MDRRYSPENVVAAVKRQPLGRTTNMHIAHINYAEVLESAFPDRDSADSYITSVERIADDPNIPATIVHQAARLLCLSDRVEEFAKGRPALQILFFIMAAEAVSKLFYKYQGQDHSKAYVNKFFNEFCTEKHRRLLSRAMKRDDTFMTTEDCVDFLYKIRCDVAHEGRYFHLSLPESTIPEDISLSQLQSVGSYIDDARVDSYISSGDLRQIIVEGSVRASQLFKSSVGAP